MPALPKITTTISTKGQVVLPKSIRNRRHWAPGTKLEVVETPEGILLKPEPLFPPTRYEEVFGAANYKGPAKTIEEMNASVLAEAKRRHEEGH